MASRDEVTAADYLAPEEEEDFSGRPPSEARSVDSKRFPTLSQLLYVLFEIVVGKSNFDLKHLNLK